MPNVTAGLFKIVERLYGLSFNLREDIPVYHPDVQAYEVTKDFIFHAVIYTDFHPREGKEMVP